MRRAAAPLALAALLALGGAIWLLASDAPRAPGAGERPPEVASAVLRAPGMPAARRAALPEAVATAGESPLPPGPDAPAAPSPEALAVAGVVRRVTGVALRGAQVDLLGPPVVDGKPAVLAQLVTGEDGRFRLESEGVRPSALTVSWRPCREVLLEGSAWEEPLPREPLTRTVELPARDPLPLQLEVLLDTGWSLAGRVTDMRGQPLEGAFVTAEKNGPEARTGFDGRFLVQDIERRPTAIAFTAWAPFRTRQTVPLDAPPSGEWRVPQDFALSRAGSVSGFVIDPDGRALPGAEVLALVAGSPDGVVDAELGRTATNALGRYLLGDLPDGTYDLVCTWQAHTPGTDAALDVRRTARLPRVDVLAEAPIGADFRLTAGVTLSGRVLEDDGTPFSRQHGVEFWSVLGADARAAPLLAQARAALEEDGSFVLTGLDPGAGELRIIGDSWGDQHTRWSARGKVEATLPWARQLGGSTEWMAKRNTQVEHTLRLELPAEGLSGLDVRQGEGRSITGLVVDADGRPLGGIAVQASPESRADRPVRTGADGAFELPLMHRYDPGLSLRLGDDVHIPVLLDLPVTSGFEQLGRVVLERAPSLKLFVVDEKSGEPLADARLSWQMYGGSRRETVVHVSPLGAAPVVLRADRTQGHWVLIVEAPGHYPWRRTAEILPGEEPLEVLVRLVRR